MCNKAKPSKKIFELAAEKANMPIKNCYYVGDNLQIDALASRNAGMKGIWLNWKGHKRPTVVTIRSLTELESRLPEYVELDFHSLF
nr:HAD-IA family hydrolase [Halalkalibacter alkalisediminis]